MRVLEEPVQAWAHCPDPRCDGYRQQQVDAVRETTEFTFRDLGGDQSGVERSTSYLRFVGDDSCPACGHRRELSDQKRVASVALSGHDPTGLLQFKAPDGTFRPAGGDDELAALRAQVAELTALVIERGANEVG